MDFGFHHLASPNNASWYISVLRGWGRWKGVLNFEFLKIGNMLVEAVQTFKLIAVQVDMKFGGYSIWSSSCDEHHVKDFCQEDDVREIFKII